MIMSSKQVIKALKIKDIKVGDILLGQKKQNKNVPITLTNKSIVFQTPFLEVKELRKTPMENIYQLDTLFKGDTEKKIKEFYQFIEGFESHILEQVNKFGTKWFTQKNIIFKSLIREDENDKGIYFLRWLIKMNPEIFVDESKNAFDYEKLHIRDSVKLIVEISDLCLDERQCGLAAFVQKIQVRPLVEKIVSEYIFDESESELETDEKSDNIISLLATEQKKSAAQENKTASPLNKKKPSLPLKNEKKPVDNNNKNENLKQNIKKLNENPSMNQKIIMNQLLPTTNRNQPAPNKLSKPSANRNIHIDPVLSDDSNDFDDVVSDKDERNRMKKLLADDTSDEDVGELNDDDLDIDI